MSDFLNMSDEDFLKSVPPGTTKVEPEVTPESTATTEPPVADDKTQDTPDVEPEVKTPDTQVAEPEVKVEPEAKPVDGGKVEDTKVADPAKPDTQVPQANPTKDAPKTETQTETKPTGAVDYEAFYKTVMAPIKANGKIVELKDPSEVISLMQMGANYTRKMQDIAPHRKFLMMLESNGLLDEGKLSYLIDLDKKNPDAIKKLVKDAGIDPMEIDTTAEPAYREGNHRVTDAEVTFHNHLDNLKSTDSGKETIRIIVNDWDQASKDALWNTPVVMETINQQRELGIYDRIVTEVNRQKTLGGIGPTTPFLQAYEHVGKAMADAGAFADLVQNAPVKTAPVPIATRTQAPKPTVQHNDKAEAAAPTRSTPKTATTAINPLSLSDEEFEKQFAQFQGRL